ncbi:hypothetical protein [Allorhizocola rhizosphaerae]|uniref:5'-methylthioadenosine/S-adenosylhomocysteine nucleosidase family protein n=1 Tax=Allorhizocola rhizosphaerae TaxID=1872709 RepID=UPI000E3BB4AE|nr:hypothetical protein [Allorhizocola rhizosphaerae]
MTHPSVYNRQSELERQAGGGRADIGVLTVLSAELRAVVAMLRRRPGFMTRDLPDGGVAYEAMVDRARAVALQAVEPGRRSAAVAYAALSRLCSPKVVALVGVAGGVHDDVGLGDVVISDQIIHYEESDSGRTTQLSGYILRRVNEFFAAHDNPLYQVSPSTGRTFKVLRGPIGSGEAVIADAASQVRAYLAACNDKTLAIETEAGGVAQAFYERAASDRGVLGWLSIRGISDLAGVDRDDLFHDIASRHAAETLERIVPYLVPAD